MASLSTKQTEGIFFFFFFGGGWGRGAEGLGGQRGTKRFLPRWVMLCISFLVVVML